jgi:hypothetical protein
MGLLDSVALDRITPAELWTTLDGSTQKLAATSLYAVSGVAASGRAEADASIARAIRFRPNAVQRLPVERRIGYLLKAVHPDDSLACSLLLALHIEQRGAILSAFLTRLGIPHIDGLIDEGFDLQPPDSATLAAATTELFEHFPNDEVELYLTSLIAIDRETWGNLIDALKQGQTG